MIRVLDLRLVAAEGSHLFYPTIPVAELLAAWVGITHAVSTLGIDHLIIEGDSPQWWLGFGGRLGLQLLAHCFVIFGDSFKIALSQSSGMSTE